MMIYLSGPMSGLPEFNFPAFRGTAAWLRSMGYDVISPAEEDEAAGFDPKTAKMTPELRHRLLARDIEIIATRCKAIALMPGWKDSAGAQIELAVAERLGLKVYLIDDVNFRIIPYHPAALGFRIELRVV